MRRSDRAVLSFLAAVDHHTKEPPESQAALARLCGELPQNFNRAVQAAQRGSGTGATLERVSRWIERWPGVPLALVVTSDEVAVFKRSDVEGNHG